MRLLIPTVILPALAAVVAAQGPASLSAITPTGVFVQADNKAPQHAARATGSTATITDPLAVRTDLVEGGNTAAHVRTKLSLRLLESLPAVRIHEAGILAQGVARRQRALGTAAQTASGGPAIAPHAWVLRYRGQAGQRVRVQVRLRSTFAGRNTWSSTPTDIAGFARVDVGNDSSVEFDERLDGRRYLDNHVATLGVSGQLDVMIETGARIDSTDATAASYAMTLDVSCEPVRDILASMTPYGECGADVYGIQWLVGTQRYTRLVLDGATPDRVAVLLIGSGSIDVPLAGMPCNLLTLPLAILPMRTSAVGRIITDMPAIPWNLTFAACFQYGTLETSGAIVLSKGLAYRIFPDSGNAYEHREINHVLSTGQSLAIGGLGSPVLSTKQAFGNLMFSNGVGGLSNRFAPLVEIFWETMSSGMSALASRMYLWRYNDARAPARTPGDSHDCLVSVHAAAGLPYQLLKKGSPPFAAGISQFRTAQAAAAKQGKSYVVRCITNVHGETDHTLFNTDYADNLIEWQADYESEIQSRGQTATVPMLHSQMSSHTAYGSAQSIIPGLQSDASARLPRKLPLVGPKYFLEYFDGVHLTSRGYRHMGEYYGKVYNHVVIEGGTWEPLRPLTAKIAGTVITVRFHVPEPPLVIDSSRVSDPGNYGFEYTDDSGQPPVIRSVHLADEDTVAIVLSQAPQANATKSIAYAYTGATGAKAGPRTGARGCLRDSDATPSLHNGPLFNWAVHFAMDVR